jgi:hypothetical protein
MRRRRRLSGFSLILVAALVISLVPTGFNWSVVGYLGVGAFLSACCVGVWRSVQRNRRTLYVNDLIALGPAGFEEAMVDLFRDLGYRKVTRTGGAGDLAADITCSDSDGRSVVIQCKCYARDNRVGSPVVQAFIGMITVHHKADHGIVVTTSSFTAAAQALAKAHRVTLYDGMGLADLVRRARLLRGPNAPIPLGAA